MHQTPEILARLSTADLTAIRGDRYARASMRAAPFCELFASATDVVLLAAKQVVQTCL
jgi:hypothetical protein